jgi:PmbA protein
MERHELLHYVEWALEIIQNEPSVRAAEVCASWCDHTTVALRYEANAEDSVQPPHSWATLGLGILVVVEDRDGRRTGFGSSDDDLSEESIRVALEMAKANAVPDPDFVALPVPALDAPTPPVLYDQQVIDLPSDELQRLALEAFEGALSTLQAAGYVRNLRFGGTVESRLEHLAVGNTSGIHAAETSTALLATLYTCLPGEPSQGTSCTGSSRLQDFDALQTGIEAAQRALRARGGTTLAPGEYTVVFGPQAVADLFQDLLLPALSLDSVAAGTSPLAARLGQQIASRRLTVTDHGRLPGYLGSHAITGEGVPTGTTRLIEDGRLVGFLADTYHAQKLAARVGTFAPQHGMRFATNDASFAMRPGIFPTNVTITGDQAAPLETLLAPIGEGIYVGGLWNIAPQGGWSSGTFTGTVIGPSYAIRRGELTQPLRPGALQLHDNALDLLQRLSGLSTTREAVPLATGRSLVIAPELRCSRARFVA